MISRGVGRAVAGLALVAAVSACDDNPLSDNRDGADRFRVNVSNAVVEVGGTVGLYANVLNQYGAALVVNVTASECSAGVSVAPDPIRSEYEYPERFIITGNSVGETCVVVSGAGVTDTVVVRVVPASIELSSPAEIVGSGEAVSLGVSYFGASGAAAPGMTFDPEHTTLVVRTASTGVVEEDGTFTARAPGTTWLVATTSYLGVTRRDSVQISVEPGVFAGTVSPSTAPTAGVEITFTAGAFPFDDDTNVVFDGIPTFITERTETTLRAILPGGVGAATNFAITNIGDNQVALGGTLPVTNPDADAYTPNDLFSNAEVLPIADGTYYYTLSEDNPDDFFEIVLTEPRSVTFTNDWNDAGVLSVLLGFDDTEAFVYNGCFAAAKPQSCTFDLPVGTSYINLWYYPAAAGAFPNTPSYPAITGRMTVEFLP